jgi:hypothetical protein
MPRSLASPPALGLCLLGLSLSGLVLAPGAAQAQQRITLRALYSGAASLSDVPPSSFAPDVQSLSVEGKKQWYAFEIEARLSPTVGLELTSAQGRLQETNSFFPPIDNPSVTRQTSKIYFNTLSLLLHPFPGHLFDFYFGPSYGQTRYDRAFASTQQETAEGGKAGFDLQLGESNWLATAQLSILSNRFRTEDFDPKRTVRYRVVGFGLGYRF